jgi:hypothetical protein
MVFFFTFLSISMFNYSQVVTISGNGTRESFGIFDDTTSFFDIATNKFYEYPYEAQETDNYTYTIDFKSNTISFLDSDLTTIYVLPFIVKYKNSNSDFLIEYIFESPDVFGIFAKEANAAYYQSNGVAATLTIFNKCRLSNY